MSKSEDNLISEENLSKKKKVNKRIVFVTGNKNKLKEVQQILKDFDVESYKIDCFLFLKFSTVLIFLIIRELQGKTKY
jgi:hypothetical protein